MKECSLCNELKLDNYLIAESEHAYCIPPLNPVKEGHVMILPKKHTIFLNELSDEIKLDFKQFLNKMVSAVIKTYGTKGHYYWVGPNVGTEPSHYHVHLVPEDYCPIHKQLGEFYGNDEKDYKSAEELKKMADKIRGNVQ